MASEEQMEYVPYPVFSSYDAYKEHIKRTQEYSDKMRAAGESKEKRKPRSRTE